MMKQRTLALLCSPNKNDNYAGSAVADRKEVSAEEQSFERGTMEGKERCQRKPNEGDPCKEPDEEPSEGSPKEECISYEKEELTEEANGEPDDGDSSEASMTRSSSDRDEEVYQSTPDLSSSKKRSIETPYDHVQKRLKRDMKSGSSIEKDLISDEIKLKEPEKLSSSGKKRHRELVRVPGGDGEVVHDDNMVRKTRTRWSLDKTQLKILGPLKLPIFEKGLIASISSDPHVQKLNSQLFEINERLKLKEVIDDQPEDERSPSPPPIYNNLGIRINTREARLRLKLSDQRQQTISNLIQKNPNFKAPNDYKPPKLYKKLYIPVKEYPGYNFFGLIIGPRGHTLKRMEQKTGARILLRGNVSSRIQKALKRKRAAQQTGSTILLQGNGSARIHKALKHKDRKADFSENEDLHVYIEADTQKSLDAAVDMIEKLLVPMEEEKNEHKLAQLRELAKLNSSMGKSTSRKILKASSKATAVCSPSDATAFSLKASHPVTCSCGALFPFGSHPDPSPTLNEISIPRPHALQSCNGKHVKEIDEAKLFVGLLPQSVNDDRLWMLFSPFGTISEAIVIKDKSTGLSKGFGFVKYTDSICAAKAVARMNGYKIDGKIITVKVAGQPLSAANAAAGTRGTPISGLQPTYLGPAALSQSSLFPVAHAKENKEHMTPEYHASFAEGNHFVWHTDPVNGNYPPYFGPLVLTPVPSPNISGCYQSSSEFSQFLGSANSLTSQDDLFQKVAFSSQCPLQPLTSPQTPFTY